MFSKEQRGVTPFIPPLPHFRIFYTRKIYKSEGRTKSLKHQYFITQIRFKELLYSCNRIVFYFLDLLN